MEQKDWEEISQWLVGGFVVFLCVRVWSTQVKPWLAQHVEALREEGEVALGPVSVATSDVVAAGVIAAVLLVMVATLRSSHRARKRAKAKERELSS